MLTLRITPTNTEDKIKSWETRWSALFLIATAVIAFVGGWLNEKWWEIAQFYGYAIASYFVGCWLGTDTRKPKVQPK